MEKWWSWKCGKRVKLHCSWIWCVTLKRFHCGQDLVKFSGKSEERDSCGLFSSGGLGVILKSRESLKMHNWIKITSVSLILSHLSWDSSSSWANKHLLILDTWKIGFYKSDSWSCEYTFWPWFETTTARIVSLDAGIIGNLWWLLTLKWSPRN